MDHNGSPSEASENDEHPEQPGHLVRGGNVSEPVDGGGLEELLHNLHAGGLSETGQYTFTAALILGDYPCHCHIEHYSLL